MKKFFALTLSCLMLATPVFAMTPESSGDTAIVERTVVTNLYEPEGDSDTYFTQIVPRETLNPDSNSEWEFGVKGLIKYSQYSYFLHDLYRHYGNAMMNDEYSGRVYDDAGKWAKAETKQYTSYNTHRSYYGWE